MGVLVGKPAPDFTAPAVMADNSFNDKFKLSELKGKYVVLFFYPLDFTFVCPTELVAFNHRLAEFKKRNCEVISVSVDSKFSHVAWKNTPGGQGRRRPAPVPDGERSHEADRARLRRPATRAASRSAARS